VVHIDNAWDLNINVNAALFSKMWWVGFSCTQFLLLTQFSITGSFNTLEDEGTSYE
jgi:hypothetical protein